MTLGEFVKSYRKAHDMTMQEFADKAGLSKGYVSMLEKGKHPQSNRPLIPSIETVGKIASAIGISVDELLNRTDGNQLIGLGKEPVQPDDRPIARRIPVLGRVAAGVPLEAITDIDDWEEIPEKLAETDEYFALTIHGDSMEPKMNEGDVVIVRRQPDVESGDIAIVRVNGYDATCKKVVKQDGGILLVGLNPSFTPIFYSKEDIESLPVQIDGKVVELRAKF